jgi:hypothetical protein
MFDPSGQVRDVPTAQAAAAQKSGGRLAVKMFDPKGTQRWVPKDMVPQALKAGGKMYSQQNQAAALEQRAMDPNSQYKPTTVSTGRTGKQTGLGRFMEKYAPGVVGAAPALGATVGGVVGSLLSPVGSAGGAGIGASAGEAYREKVTGEKLSPKKIATEGGEQAALEYVGGTMAPKLIAKIGAKASPRVAELVNRYIGLKPGSMPKFGRTISNARQVAKTVVEKAGIKPNLEAQHAAIEVARKKADDQTLKLVQTDAGRLVDVKSKILDLSSKLDKKLSLGEYPEFTKQMIDANVEEFENIAKEHGATSSGNMVPAQMHAMRRSIQKQITDWDPKTRNLRQKFLQDVYHSLNEGIAQGLPSGSSRSFLRNNRTQTLLIQAREAAAKKLTEQGTSKAKRGIASKVATAGAGAAIGAAGGALYGLAGGGRGEGGDSGGSGSIGSDVLRGAGWGLLAGTGVAGAREVNLPVLDIKAQQTIAKLAPALAKAAKHSPAAARALQAIQSIQSRPQNQ